MIKITIERVTREHYKETQRFCITESPTKIVKQSYGGSEEVQFERSYEAREVPMQRDVKATVLTQEIQDDDSFNLAAVIRAINGLQ